MTKGTKNTPRKRSKNKSYCIKSIFRRVGISMKRETFIKRTVRNKEGALSIWYFLHTKLLPAAASKHSLPQIVLYHLLHLLACHVSWSRTLGNKMLTESIIQCFPLPTSVCFLGLFLMWKCYNFIRKMLWQPVIPKPTSLSVDLSINSNKAIS